MRILHTECGLNWGGQEFRTLIECQWLNDHGHQAWIMCHGDSELYKRCIKEGFSKVIAMNLTKTWRVDIWLKVLSFVLSNRIDIINSHGSRDSIICTLSYLFGKPLLRSRQVTNPIRRSFSYRSCCSHIIAAAGAIKASLIDVGVAAEKITVIGEGVDIAEFAPRPRPQCLIDEFDIGEDEKVVINIGMIRHDKGQRYFIQAAEKVLTEHSNSKVRFILVGDATRKKQLKAELEQLVVDLGIEKQCLMVGYRNDVADFINLADLVVIASTGTEAQSRIVPQSFASKTTVVSTNTGGLTELVTDQVNGLVVQPQDSEAMAMAIESLLFDEALRQSYESEAYQFALEQLSLEQMMHKTLDLYGEYCSE